ncbi:MAG: hypothetical protein LBV67_04255 [Streptococcaceae bacterium]|jgi:hypothetical protein|nr:hypothetical protein [Streptococcaceae bacterium]
MDTQRKDDFNLNLFVEERFDETSLEKDGKIAWSVFGCGGTTIPCALATNATKRNCVTRP